MTEFETKQKRIQEFLAARQLDALLLRRVSSFAWATCGASSYVNTATTEGAASLLITQNGRYIITNSIEAPRLEQEEHLVKQGWEMCITPWYKPSTTIEQLTRGLNLGSDMLYPNAVNLQTEVAYLRANLLPEEVERIRAVGRLTAEAMNSAIRSVKPGQTEQEIAGLVALYARQNSIHPIVNLIAVDERIYAFRHPLPTDKRMERYALLGLVGRKQGLCCSISRLVHFGAMDDELTLKMQATARIDATLITATRPGATLADIFKRATDAYAQAGFPDEWHKHHQGGATGYQPREYLGTPDSKDVVAVNQVYAWNPSITGCKSEDTILVGEKNNTVLTEIVGWPKLSVTIGDETIMRPAILKID
jgi:Xaa-Pro aminopeptidase